MGGIKKLIELIWEKSGKKMTKNKNNGKNLEKK